MDISTRKYGLVFARDSSHLAAHTAARVWLDCDPPTLMMQSAPAARASAMKYSSLRTWR